MALFQEKSRVKKRRHHYLPRFYLRNFASQHPKGKLWVYTKDAGSFRAASPRDLAIEKDYHTVVRRDGVVDRNTIEDTVASLENIAAPVIQKILREAAVSFDDHQIFALFISQLLLRVPARRDAVAGIMSEMFKQMAKRFAENKESYHADYSRFQKDTGDKSELDPEELRQFLLSDDYDITVNSSAAVGASLGAIGTVVNCLVRMNWVFVRASGRFRFLTCDNPVFYCDPTLPANSPGGVGLANTGVEVSCPLSPDVLAFGCYRPVPRSRANASPETVRRFNQQTIDSAYRYVFACEGSAALQRFIRRNNDASRPVEPYVR
jgi:Protein of unknown function (DUF4238)